MNSRLLRKIAQTNSIADIDAVAYDVAYEFEAKAHALIEVDHFRAGKADQSARSLVLISNRLSADARRLLIDDQSESFGKVHGLSAGFRQVQVWNDLDEQWRPLDTEIDAFAKKSADDSATVTIGLFVFAGQHKVVGFILQDVPLGRNLGGTGVFQSVASDLIARFFALGPPSKPRVLSQSEHNCLIWCASGKTSSEIATILSLSEHTVNQYFTVICIKLDASNRTHAVAKAIKMGLLDINDIV